MFDYTNTEVTFVGWPKTPRDRGGNVTITEKIDGTNACVIVKDGIVVGAQSRNRLVNIGDDNMGFASWVFANRKELAGLGEGYHYGEWAGPGIQKNPHQLAEKTFFLFNVARPQESLPECVQQVPVLYQGPGSKEVYDRVMRDLWVSAMTFGYQPEGIIIYQHDSRQRVKDTFLNRKGKWEGNMG